MRETASGPLPSRVLAEHRREVLELVRARGADNVRVFGSVARGDDSPSSDIDLLVDFPPGTSLLAVNGLEQALRELLGVAVAGRCLRRGYAESAERASPARSHTGTAAQSEGQPGGCPLRPLREPSGERMTLDIRGSL